MLLYEDDLTFLKFSMAENNRQFNFSFLFKTPSIENGEYDVSVIECFMTLRDVGLLFPKADSFFRKSY